MSQYVHMTAYAERIRLEIKDLVDGVAGPSYSRQVAALLADGSARDLAGLLAGDLAPLEAWLHELTPVTGSLPGQPRSRALRRDLSCTAELVDVLEQVKPHVQAGARLDVPDNTPLADLRNYADGLVRPGERLIHSLAADPPKRWARRMRRALRWQARHPDQIVPTVWTLPWATAAQLAGLTAGDLLPFVKDPELRKIARRALPHAGAAQAMVAP